MLAFSFWFGTGFGNKFAESDIVHCYEIYAHYVEHKEVFFLPLASPFPRLSNLSSEKQLRGALGRRYITCCCHDGMMFVVFLAADPLLIVIA